MSDKQPDKRIGKRGAYEPKVCAVTGQHVNGNHNTTIKITGLYFFRVLNKAKPQADIDAIRAELLPLVETKTKSKVSEVKTDDK